MTNHGKDLNWLRDQLVELLVKAKGAEAPDHQACASYASLLFKILPPASEELDVGSIDLLRDAIRHDQQVKRQTDAAKMQ